MIRGTHYTAKQINTCTKSNKVLYWSGSTQTHIIEKEEHLGLAKAKVFLYSTQQSREREI